MSSIDSISLTRADVAWLVGMSDSWVRDRMQAGDFPRPGETAEEYVEAFVNYRVGKLAQDDGAGINFEIERARLTKEQADAKAMDNAERRGELASLPDMSGAVVSVIALAVARLQQVGLTVANGDHRLRERIDTAINDALDELTVAKVEEARGAGVPEEEVEEPGGAD